MKRFAGTLLVLAALAGGPAALAADCPTYIYYKNGNYLKSGSYFYYDNGTYLKSGSYLYHPNGNYLKNGSYVYYDNGNYLRSGSYLYYPNGNYLKSGSYFYYSSGNYLKSGSYFYHKNGSYARSGQTLYREDGSVTEFPVLLSESIGTAGTVRFTVGKTSEEFELRLDSFVNSSLVRAELLTNGTDITSFKFSINTGHPNEYVVLTMADDGTTSCQLSSSGTPANFTIDSDAATVQVQVKAGYDPAQVKRVLQEALDSL